MKLVVSWAPTQTGSALAYLVACLRWARLCLRAVRFLGAAWKWQHVILCSSALALIAAGLIYLLGDGPHLAVRGESNRPADGQACIAGVRARSQSLRAAALGYFGHMWELYTFWTLVPLYPSQRAAAKVCSVLVFPG